MPEFTNVLWYDEVGYDGPAVWDQFKLFFNSDLVKGTVSFILAVMIFVVVAKVIRSITSTSTPYVLGFDTGYQAGRDGRVNLAYVNDDFKADFVDGYQTGAGTGYYDRLSHQVESMALEHRQQALSRTRDQMGQLRDFLDGYGGSDDY